MSWSKSPLSFDDVRSTLQRALDTPKGIRIKFPTAGAAITFRQRCNHFRQADRKANRGTYAPDHPLHSASAYDELVLTIPKKGSPGDNVLSILKRAAVEFEIEEIL